MENDEKAAMERGEATFLRKVREIDERAGRILTYHAHLETEIGRLVAVLLPRGELLNRMGFGNLVRVLQAAYWAKPEITDSLIEFLKLFNELRNSIAHGDNKKAIDHWVEKLRSHYLTMPGGDHANHDASIDAMASDISGTLGGMIYSLEKERPPFP